MYDSGQSPQDYLIHESIRKLETWCLLTEHDKSKEQMTKRLVEFYELWQLNKIAAAKLIVDAQFCTNQDSYSSDLTNLNQYISHQFYFSLARVALNHFVKSIDWRVIAEAIESSVLEEVRLIVSEAQQHN